MRLPAPRRPGPIRSPAWSPRRQGREKSPLPGETRSAHLPRRRPGARNTSRIIDAQRDAILPCLGAVIAPFGRLLPPRTSIADRAKRAVIAPLRSLERHTNCIPMRCCAQRNAGRHWAESDGRHRRGRRRTCWSACQWAGPYRACASIGGNAGARAGDSKGASRAGHTCQSQ
jgi:hypothetical protein